MGVRKTIKLIHIRIPSLTMFLQTAKFLLKIQLYFRQKITKPLPANLACIFTAQRENVTDSMTLKWVKCWGATGKGKDLRRIMPSPSKQVLNLHRGINKAHSTPIVQMRTAKIGLRHLSRTSKVPGITNGKCKCRRENQSVRHITTQCRKHSQLRRDTWMTLEKREPCGPIEWTKVAKSPPPLDAQKAAIFMKNTRRLSQFDHIALIPPLIPPPE